LVYNAPERGYWEYSAGIGNILKFVLILLWEVIILTRQGPIIYGKGSFDLILANPATSYLYIWKISFMYWMPLPSAKK
jgi:hypothetical protein